MRIVVLGGGVVGVTTAYQLQKDGHEVALLERNSDVAAGTSWGNAGMIAPGHSFVWSSPTAPMTLAKSLVLKDQALRFKLSADPRLYSWSWLFLMECTPAKARRNTLLKHRLAAYSQTVLKQVVAEEAIEYDRNDRGILYFHRSQQALDAGVEHMKLLESDGQVIKVLDRDGVVALDPSLASAKGEIVGGIYCPTDETGDPAKFTRALAAKIVARGGAIHTDATIAQIESSGDKISKVATDKGDFTRRRLCARARIAQPDLRAQDWHSIADLSDQGLCPDHTDRQSQIAADDRVRRRTQSCRHFPLRRSSPRHRDGGVRRLRHEPQAVRFRFHETGDAGALSRRGGLRARRNVGRPQADDPDQPSIFRPTALPQPFPEYRARPHRLDDVARLGSDYRRLDRRPHAGHPDGGSGGRLNPKGNPMPLDLAPNRPVSSRPIDLGVLPSELDEGLASRAAIGLVVLATDQTMEHEFRALVRLPGVAFYESRVFSDNDINPDDACAP